jgi:hypothetical protein
LVAGLEVAQPQRVLDLVHKLQVGRNPRGGVEPELDWRPRLARRATSRFIYGHSTRLQTAQPLSRAAISSGKTALPRTAAGGARGSRREQVGVAAKGQGCADFEASDPNSRLTIGGLPAGDDGSCTIDGQRSELTVYRNATDLKTVVRAAPTLGCSIGKSFGITAWRYVVGSTWTIHTPSSATTKPLAKALGATPVVIKCK